jgi:2-dehydro-3-deoxy-D-arabinonate dehydratase
MQLCQFHVPGVGPRVGCVRDGAVIDLTASETPQFATVSSLLQASTERPVAELLAQLRVSDLPSLPQTDLAIGPSATSPYLLPPVDRQEIWAAGVTYAWSREARVREAKSKEVYVRVYEAQRPELFFKALGEKTVGPGDWIGIRGDSAWDVPEPELGLVLNPQMEIVGYTAGNDVSSRSIEGENPLYLPQAKVYSHSCSLGPVITLAGEEIDGEALDVRLTIDRKGATVFGGETNTSNMNRGLPELAAYLGRHNHFPYGAVLLTGTGIVPGDDFTLQDGDVVTVEVYGIGSLINPVRLLA